MPFSYAIDFDPTAIWNVLRSAITGAGSIGEWAKGVARFTEFETLDSMLLFRAATLGTDVEDGVGTITHGITTEIGYPSYSRLITEAVNTSDVVSYTDIATQLISPFNRRPPGEIFSTMVYEAHLELEQLTAMIVVAGFWTEIAYISGAVERACFIYDTGVDPNWHTRTYNTAQEDQDTGIAVVADWATLRIEVEAAAVRFYIDNVLVTTHVTQVPDNPVDAQQPMIGIRTLAVATKAMKYEYVAVWNELQ